MSKYFPKPKSLEEKFENATGADISDFANKTDLAYLKSDVDKLDIDKLKNVNSNKNNLKKVEKLYIGKLETTPFYLSNLSLVVKLTIIQILIKLKRKLMVIIIMNILLLTYLINWRQKIFLQHY